MPLSVQSPTPFKTTLLKLMSPQEEGVLLPRPWPPCQTPQLQSQFLTVHPSLSPVGCCKERLVLFLQGCLHGDPSGRLGRSLLSLYKAGSWLPHVLKLVSRWAKAGPFGLPPTRKEGGFPSAGLLGWDTNPLHAQPCGTWEARGTEGNVTLRLSAEP